MIPILSTVQTRSGGGYPPPEMSPDTKDPGNQRIRIRLKNPENLSS